MNLHKVIICPTTVI